MAPMLVLVTVAALIRGLYLFEAAQLPNFAVPYAGLDADMYQQLAQRIADGDFLLGPHPFYFSALYAYFLSGLQWFLGFNQWVPRLTNMVMGSLTVGCVFFYSRSFLDSKKIAYVTTLLAAFYGPLVVFDTSAMKTSLGLFLVSFSLFLLSGLKNRSGVLTWLLIGLFMGLAANLSGQITVFIFSLLITLFVSTGLTKFGLLKSKIGIRIAIPMSSIVCFFAGLCLATLPFIIRNQIVVGEPILGNSTSGLHFYIGNQTKAWGGYTGVPGIRPNPAGHFFDAKRTAEKNVGHALKDSEISRYWKQRAWHEIRSNPNAFLKLTYNKLLLIISPYEIPNNDNYQFLKKRSDILPFLPGAGLVLPLCFSGWLMAIWQRRGPLLLHLYVVSYIAALLFSIITWRYRLPLLLGLLPFGALLIFEVGKKINDGKRIHVSIIVLLFIGFWAAGHVHPVAQERGASDFHKAELKMQWCQKITELYGILSSEVEMNPRKHAYTLLKIARLHHRQGDIEGAVRVLQLALKEFPHHTGLQRFYHELSLRTG